MGRRVGGWSGELRGGGRRQEEEEEVQGRRKKEEALTHALARMASGGCFLIWVREEGRREEQECERGEGRKAGRRRG
jgi:hypothetical protein